MTPLVLQAGPLQLVLQPDEGAVRWVCFDGHEILRGINAPVRDHGWGTVPPRVESLELDRRDDRFRASFVVRCQGGAVDFRWRGEVTGTADGTLDFSFAGEALADFARNRIGFCVLYPASAAGAACAVEHVDGTRADFRLPQAIQPDQPAMTIRGLRHAVVPGLTAEVRFEGDTFEMEDQRNWTDASFKVYCTPLAEPAPVAIARGTRIRQQIRVRVSGAAARLSARAVPPWQASAEVGVTLQPSASSPLPAIGTVWNALEPADAIVDALRPLALDHLRVELVPEDESHRARLAAAATAAIRLGLALEIAVLIEARSEAAFAALRRSLETMAGRPRIARWIVLRCDAPCTAVEDVQAWRTALRGTPHEAPIGGGATDNFAELNRHRAIAAAADFTVHACNPQVHAGDDATLFESLPMQGLTAAAARRISGGKPVCVSPVTLSRRWRPTDPGAPLAGVGRGLLPFQPDARLQRPLASAWTLGSIAALTAGRAASVTLHAAVGESGLVSAAGDRQPLAAAFAALVGRTGAAPWHAVSDEPTAVAAVGCAGGDGARLVLANLRATPVRAIVRGAGAERAVELAPFAIVALAIGS